MISDRMFSSRRTVTWLGGVAALATAFALGCSDTTQPTVKPTPAGMGRLAVYAVTPTSSGITGLSLTVSGPGIVKADGTADTLVFNLTMSNGTATGSITIPSGPARVITGHAFAGATETHRGSVTMDIVQGTNPTVTITLVPFVGNVPITINVGTSLVIVTPDSVEAAIGDTLRFKAKVLDNTGNAINGVVRWASVDPARVTIDTLGLATVRDTGKAHIVATYGTVGGYAEIHATKASTVSYHLTWNGSVSTNWTDTANWTPHGTATVSRVPTAADSVVIPSAPTNQPMINACSDAQVMDLVVQAGAQLSTGCYGYGVKVVRSVASQGKINVPLHVQKGATLAGALGDLYIEGDSVTLADTVSSRNVQITGTGSGLLLNGKRMTVSGDLGASNMSRVILGGARLLVTGNLALNDSSWVVVKSANDTLSVRGTFTVGSHKTIADSSFSAGVLRIGGYLYATNPASFAVMGTLKTYIDGSSYQYLQVDSTALNNGTWPGVRLSSNNHVYFSPYYYSTHPLRLTDFTIDSTATVDFSAYYYSGVLEVVPLGGELIVQDTLNVNGNVQITGKLTLAAKAAQVAGSPTVPTPTIGGSGYLTVTKPFSTGTGSTVTIYSVTLNDSTGTANVAGAFAPTYTTFAAAAPVVKPSLAYKGVSFTGATTGVILSDSAKFDGNLSLANKSRLVLNGHRLLVTGDMTMKDTSWVEMTNAGDTLNVRGKLTVGAKNTLAPTPLLSAGVLRIGGGLDTYTNGGTFGFATSGTKTLIDGTSTQYLYLSPKVLNYSSTSGGTWDDVHVIGNNHVEFYGYNTNDTLRLTNFSIDSAAAVMMYPYYSQGMVVTPKGGTLAVKDSLIAYYNTVQINGAMTLAGQTPGGTGTLAGAIPSISGSANLIVTGALTTGAGSTVTITNLTLGDGTGTSNVAGAFTPGTVTFTAATPTVKPNLGYKSVALVGAAVTLSDSSTFAGGLSLSKNSSLVLNGHRLLVGGDMLLSDSSWFKMTNVNDTLNVRGRLTVGTKNTLSPAALLTNGVLRLGGNLDAYSNAANFSFATSGTKTLIDGPTTQYIQVNPRALNYVSSGTNQGGTWDNVHIIGTNRVEIDAYTNADTVRFTGFSIDSTASLLLYPYYSNGMVVTPQGGTLTVKDTLIAYSNTIQINGDVALAAQGSGGVGTLTPAAPSINGSATLIVTGKLTTGTGSSVTVNSLTLADTSGTGSVQGTFAPQTVTFTNPVPNFKPALGYRSVAFTGSQTSVTLTDTAKFDGTLTMSNGSHITLGGHRLLVTGAMTMNDTSYVSMSNANDTLNVRGNLQFGSKTGSFAAPLLANGVLRVGGYLTASTTAGSFAPGSNHLTVFDGTGNQYVQVDTAALNSATWTNVKVSAGGTVIFYTKSTSSGSVTIPNFTLDSGAVNFYYHSWSITPAGGKMTLGSRLSVNTPVTINGAVNVPANSSIDGNNALTITGKLTTLDTTSTVSVSTLALSDTSGTDFVVGKFSPTVLTLKGSGMNLKPGLPYKALSISGSANFAASTTPYTFSGAGSLSTNASMSVANGATVSFCNYTLTNNGSITNNGVIKAGVFNGTAATPFAVTTGNTTCP